MTRERNSNWSDEPPATTHGERFAILVIVVSLIAALWAAAIWSAVALMAWLS
jgi:hypothetical protein